MVDGGVVKGFVCGPAIGSAGRTGARVPAGAVLGFLCRNGGLRVRVVDRECPGVPGGPHSVGGWGG